MGAASPGRRQQILEALKRRLEAIETDAVVEAHEPFQTDAGAAVYLGEVLELGPDDPDYVVAISPAPDQPTWSNRRVAIAWDLEIQAIAKADLEEPWVTVEEVIADIKRAVELDDRTLGDLLTTKGMERGATRMLEREPTSLTVGAGVTYRLMFVEAWGHPEG